MDVSNIKAAVFDVDGTLVDSNGIWFRIYRELLEQYGKVPRKSLETDMFPYNIHDSAVVLKRDYAINEDVAILDRYLRERIDRAYECDFRLKPGVYDFLMTLHSQKIPMGVLSASESYLVKATLKDNGIIDLFQVICSTADWGVTKQVPMPFIKTAELMGKRPEDIWFFEDAPYSLETAKKTGYRTCGIKDGTDEGIERDARKASDRYLVNMMDW